MTNNQKPLLDADNSSFKSGEFKVVVKKVPIWQSWLTLPALNICFFIGSLFYFLPLYFKKLLLSILAFVFFDLFRFRRQIVMDGLAKAQAYQKKQNEENSVKRPIHLQRGNFAKIGRRSILHVLWNLFEFFGFRWMTKESVLNLTEVEGVEHLDRALKKGKGVLFLGLHMGHGDLALSALTVRGYSVFLITKFFKNPALNAFWFKFRSRFGLKLIAPHGAKTPFEILRALKSKECVVFVLDQYMGPPYGVKTDFFGIPTGTAYGLSLFAGKTGAPVLPIYAIRGSDGKQRVIIEEELSFAVPSDTQKEQALVLQTDFYNKKLEAIILKHPEEWMWIHRRFKPF